MCRIYRRHYCNDSAPAARCNGQIPDQQPHHPPSSYAVISVGNFYPSTISLHGMYAGYIQLISNHLQSDLCCQFQASNSQLYYVSVRDTSLLDSPQCAKDAEWGAYMLMRSQRKNCFSSCENRGIQHSASTLVDQAFSLHQPLCPKSGP